MGINKDSLKGYLLEEVLAYLIRNSGYKLLVHSDQHPRDLAMRSHGLVVKGRGALHQADVLGQLEWIPAFTFPIRLFVEAKFKKASIGINEVRNAVGTLLDINQNNSPIRETDKIYQKFQYVYALFSASGFSRYASEMALAHQISLIDMSGSEFDRLKSIIESVAIAVINKINYTRINKNGTLVKTDSSHYGKYTRKIRNILRKKLETWPKEVAYPHISADNDDEHVLGTALSPAISAAREYNELFVAMANGPFMLLLNADNNDNFIRYASTCQKHKVTITWSAAEGKGTTWKIKPVDSRLNAPAYTLSFRLPKVLSRYIFGASTGIEKRAMHTKQEFFSKITIYRHVDGIDYLFRLEYDAKKTKEHVEKYNRCIRRKS